MGLHRDRSITAGSEANLGAAIRRGVDLYLNTAFRYDEHTGTTADNNVIVQDVLEFRMTYLLEDRWMAGIVSLGIQFLGDGLNDALDPRRQT